MLQEAKTKPTQLVCATPQIEQSVGDFFFTIRALSTGWTVTSTDRVTFPTSVRLHAGVFCLNLVQPTVRWVRGCEPALDTTRNVTRHCPTAGQRD